MEYRRRVPFRFSNAHGGGDTDPGKLSTLQILRNPLLFQASAGLLQKLRTKEMTAEEVMGRMGLEDSQLEPVDPQEFNQKNESKESPRKVKKGKAKEGKVKEGKVKEAKVKEAKVKEAKVKEAEVKEAEVKEAKVKDQGETLIREFYDRVNATSKPEEDNPSDTDTRKTSASKCFRKAFTGYEKKCEAYKRHCRRIRKLTLERLEVHYKAIRPILRDIFEGKVQNMRTNYYLQGPVGLKILQDMSVSIPFEHNQTVIIINKMLEYFVPDVLDRPNWSNYISYVLLPEALINIYARVNKVSFGKAENEMRFRGCYEDEDEEQPAAD